MCVFSDKLVTSGRKFQKKNHFWKNQGKCNFLRKFKRKPFFPRASERRVLGRRPCQPTGLRVSQPESASRKARVSQQEGASQPTGRRESANQEGASQPTRKARVSQPGRRESANQVASQPTRSRVRQPVASQPTRSRVSQPGRESANQVASQTTGRESANRSRVSQPGRESANQFASQTTRTHAGHEKKRNEMRGIRERTWKEMSTWNFCPTHVGTLTNDRVIGMVTVNSALVAPRDAELWTFSCSLWHALDARLWTF